MGEERGGLYCRNPFLSRAGFDSVMEVVLMTGRVMSRNPFLSRAGFDTDGVN